MTSSFWIFDEFDWHVDTLKMQPAVFQFMVKNSFSRIDFVHVIISIYICKTRSASKILSQSYFKMFQATQKHFKKWICRRFPSFFCVSQYIQAKIATKWKMKQFLTPSIRFESVSVTVWFQFSKQLPLPTTSSEILE